MGWFRRLMKMEDASPRERGPGWAPFFTSRQHGLFLEEVGAALDRLHVRFRLGEGVVEATLCGARQQLGLQGLAQTCHLQPQSRWPALIQRHFERFLEAEQEREEALPLAGDFEQARSHLRVRLYPPSLAQQLQQSMVTWTPAEGLLGVLCLDLPSSLVSVSREQAARWGLTDAQLLAVALDNHRAEARPPRGTMQGLQGVTLEVLLGQDVYASTHLLFLEESLPGPAPYGALVAVPQRNVVLFHPIRDVGAWHAATSLLVMADGMFREGPGGVSPSLYWWREGRLVRLEGRVEEGAVHFTPPAALEHVLAQLAQPS